MFSQYGRFGVRNQEEELCPIGIQARIEIERVLVVHAYIVRAGPFAG